MTVMSIRANAQTDMIEVQDGKLYSYLEYPKLNHKNMSCCLHDRLYYHLHTF